MMKFYVEYLSHSEKHVNIIKRMRIKAAAKRNIAR